MTRGGVAAESTGAATSNLDLYQVNGTYFEALGSDDAAQIISRLIQVFYQDPADLLRRLLAAPNDMALLRRTASAGTSTGCITPPSHSRANSNGRRSGRSFTCSGGGHPSQRCSTAPSRSAIRRRTLVMRWEREGRWAELRVDLADRTYEVDVDGAVVNSVDDLRIG